MTWFIKIVLEVLIDKFFDLSIDLFKKAALKRKIQIIAKENLEHIASGDNALSQGNINNWLQELNNEK